MQVQTIASATLPSTTLSTADLHALGLNEADIPEIQDVALRIQSNNPLSVAEFGREIATHTSSYADALLDQVRNSDLDEAGAKLTQVLTVAQGVNVNALLDTRSRIPVLGPLLDRFNLKRRQVLGEFDTTLEQIEKLLAEVSMTHTGLSERNVALEDMYNGVRGDYRLLGIHIAAGKQRLGELIAESNALRADINNNPSRLQQLSDLDNQIANLDKRIGDFTVEQQSALQTLPTIRLLQNNNQQLIDKFATIRTVAIPAWKRGFMLAISLNEQRNSVHLANSIDDATNDLMRRNAELLHHNSVETAKANQRLVIDLDTLKFVQDSLIQTVEEVLKLQRSGAESRQKAERDIQGMRLNLQQRLTHSDNAPRHLKELH